MTRREQGLSLVELIVVVGILGALGLVVSQVFRHQSMRFLEQNARTATLADARTWLARMASDLRSAGYDPTESENFGILTGFSDTEVRFTRDSDDDGTVDPGPPEEVGYRWDATDNTLYLWQGSTSWRPVLVGVTTFQINYFDAAGNAVTTAAKAVRRVEIDVELESPKGATPGSPIPRLTRSVTTEIRNES